MSVNKEFADIVHNSLGDVDEMGDDILMEEHTFSPRMYRDEMPPMVFPFGYMIISSTFMFYDDEENEDRYKEF